MQREAFNLQNTIVESASKVRAMIIAWTTWLFVSLWSRSIKVRFVNREVPEQLVAEGKNIIYTFFHGDLFLLPHTHRDSGVVIPVSESRDGEIMARVLRHFGFAVVRGSTKRRGHKALLSLINGMRKGQTAALAVDGPRGPLHEVKKGALFLAGLLRAPIVPVAVSAKRFFVLEKSWDRLMVPAPFTEGMIRYGDPIYVNGTSEREITEAQKKLEACLHGLKHNAHSGTATRVGNTQN